MTDLRALKSRQLDALREVANMGAGHAATALSQMTGSRIMISVPTITIARLDDVVAELGDSEAPMAAVLMQMTGDLTGRTMLLFPQATAERLATMMLRHHPEPSTGFGELEQSAIKEAGNILSGAYLNALSDFLGLMLLPSPPSLAMDMAAAILTSVYVQFATDRDRVVAVETEFLLDDREERLRGIFLMLPDDASLQLILRAVGGA
ncbi:MAG: chemotaxis protein CheC [Gemmatimonadaceae bacterium]